MIRTYRGSQGKVTGWFPRPPGPIQEMPSVVYAEPATTIWVDADHGYLSWQTPKTPSETPLTG
jgi:hypothetical protein